MMVLAAGLESFTKKTATVVGKPNTFCIDYLVEEHGVERSKILFIGDNLRTDIKLANNSGVDSFLVLTGSTPEDELEKYLSFPQSGVPTYIGRNLSAQVQTSS